MKPESVRERKSYRESWSFGGGSLQGGTLRGGDRRGANSSLFAAVTSRSTTSLSEQIQEQKEKITYT